MTTNLHRPHAAFGPVGARALSVAEHDGAAPGADAWPFPDIAAQAPRPVRRTRVLAALAGLVLAAGLSLVANAGWLHAKATLGQWLLARAWTASRISGAPIRPWPWADTHPVARLTVPAQGIELLVLEGANGRTLAWGPGHAEASPLPGERGNAVVTGHRDTHFAFLRHVAKGDALTVETASGARTDYRVVETRIVDYRKLKLASAVDRRRLTLVTCWPFDAIDPGTPLRYVVVAESVPPIVATIGSTGSAP